MPRSCSCSCQVRFSCSSRLLPSSGREYNISPGNANVRPFLNRTIIFGEVCVEHLTKQGRKIYRKHFLAAVKHPHHYYTAAILTVVLMVLGKAAEAEITIAWLYAFVETAVTGEPPENL